MKKVFLFLTMLLFALTSVTRAEEVEIGAGTTTTTSYFPTYTYYNYCITQQIFAADEIGTNGNLAAICFNVKSGSASRNLKIFMKEVSYNEFASGTAWESFTADEAVFDGTVNFAPGWVRVMLDRTFTYNGTGNLLVCVCDESGSYVSAITYYAWNQNVSYCRLHAYNDNNPYDYTNPAVSGSLSKWKNNIKLLFLGESEITATPDTIDFGMRANGAWMAPVSVQLENLGAVATVSEITPDNDFFVVDAEAPFTVNFGETVNFDVLTGEMDGIAAITPVEGNVVVVYTGNRDITVIPVQAQVYEPEAGDVVENAVEVTTFPYEEISPEIVYKNYELPNGTANADAVFKVTFDNEVLFTAGNKGINGRTFLYREDADGICHPAADNNYNYTGPEVGPSPVSKWFYYGYDSGETWYGTADGGGFYWGYKIPADVIAANGLEGLTITTIETAARESFDYECYILEGGDEPTDGTLIGYGVKENPEAMYFFDLRLEQPALIGTEDIWVIMFSDSPYAGYCGYYPVDANAKVWTYNPNSTSPAWTSNSSYTPVIYCQCLELPSGRSVNLDLAQMTFKSEPTGNVFELTNVEGAVLNQANAQRYNEMKANRGNREVQTLIQEGFESGAVGWTVSGHSSTGIYNNYANTGDYCFRFYYSATPPQYLISPELTDNNGGTMSFYCRAYSGSYPESYQFGYSTTTADVSEFTWGTEETVTSLLYEQKSFDFPAGTKYVAIKLTSDDQFYFLVDDITITADIASGGTPAEYVYDIDSMYMSAGTYYVVMAAEDTKYPVNMFVSDVPVPEQAVIISPYDTQTNVEAPWLMEWVLGDYTAEMQVLCGSTFPPTTPLIDWTDQLMNATFLTELDHNKIYFLQVNARNSAGVTEGEIIGFTTVIDEVEGFNVVTNELYPDTDAEFYWDANRSIRGYNLYMDGVKVNDEIITGTTYTVPGDSIAYNMTTGYDFQITAVYDEGESAPSAPINVKKTGYGAINGHVWEVDSITPVYNVAVQLTGVDEFGHNQVIGITPNTNPSGYYVSEEVLAGHYVAKGFKDGYNIDGSVSIQGEAGFTIVYDNTVADEDIIMYEEAAPLGRIKATLQEEENNVLVEWSWDPPTMMVDFETGDFSQAEFNLPASYPWAITTTNPHEGTYCMKSTCEGVASGTSTIEVTVDVPFDGKMGFWVRVSSESNYDKFHFYIDGVEQGQAISGQVAYTQKEYDITEGTHTYKWEYSKDSSVNSNDDCVYVDDITMYRLDEPVPPTPGAQVFDFDDSTMQGWTTIDADGDGDTWEVASTPMSTGYGHNASNDCVLSKSYYQGVVLYPDNYMVSPTKIACQNGASISFYACAQDAAYAQEHFGVAVSTGTNNNAAGFTTIQEWTMTAKGAQGATVDSEHDLRGTRAQGAWYQFTVDLSSYAGQEIWVALRHFNCSDWFYLDVDDITINDGSAKRVEQNRSLQGYNLYRRNMYGAGDTTQIATPAIDVYSYIDNEWASLPFGIYSWGIQARYEGNHHYPEKGRAVQVIDFETGDFSQYEFTNNSAQPWTVVTADNGSSYCMKSGNAGIASSSSVISVVVNYTADGTVSFDANCQGEGTSTFWDHCDFSIDGNVMMSNGANVSGWQNYSYPVTAGEHTFTWSYTKDSSVNPTGDCFLVDNITFDGVAGSSAAGGANNSEILWSNEIEKDMEANVVYHIALNNDQDPAGATVTMVGEETYEGTFVADTLAIEGIRKGNYTVTVELEGYQTVTTDLLIEADAEYDIFLEEVLEVVDNLYVSPTGWARWATSTATTGNTAGAGSTIGGHTGGPTPPTPPGGSTTFTEGFEGGLNGWQQIKVNADGGEWLYNQNNLGGYDYSTLAHTGSGFAMCYSFVDYVGSFDTDCYLYTPQKYSIVNGSTLTFWADNANDSYPESFSVCVATADSPTASDFTQVWGGSAKGTSKGDAVRHINNRYENWRQHTIDLSAYAGQDVYIAFHDVNYDMYEVWIDDVVLDVVSKGERAALVYKVKLDGEYLGETPYLFYQHDVEGFAEGETHVTEVAPVYASGMGDWASYTWTYVPCDNFTGATNVAAAENEPGTAVELSWTMPDGTGPTPPTPPTPGTGQWYYYDNGVCSNNIGAGGAFYWASMWPAGSYTGEFVTKVATYDDGYGFTGTATIYQGGTNAPGTAVGTTNVNIAGGANDFVEIEFAEPVAIDDSQNLWVVFYNASSTDYPAATSDDCGDANARWVSLDGSSWMDLGTAGVPGYSWMIRVYVAEGAKGEVQEINVPAQPCVNAGALSMTPANRDMWDLVFNFNGTSAGQQAVATDGQFIYTASWQETPTGGNTFYKYGLDGTFIEGFDISGATGIRDLTTDGDYFYGTSGGAQIFILDFTNKTLVGTMNFSGCTSRHISYDPERDGFWCGNWSTLQLFDRNGTAQLTAPAPSSAYGSAYYKDADDVEHLYLFCQPNSDCKVYDYNIATNTISSSVVFDYTANAPGCTGIAGGCFVGTYNDKTCWFGNAQQDPNLIAIFELEAGTVPPVPPVPSGDIIGSVILRDGEIIAVIEDPTVNTYVDEEMEIGEHEYCVRVIYGGEPDSTFWAMSCPVCATVNYTGVVENDVVENLYPNPTHDRVTIEAVDMKHITVLNTLGQVVYDADVNGDMIQLSLGQYKAGLYLIRVNTQNGVSVKRVTVVK